MKTERTEYERELLLRVQQGDPMAFSELDERYRPVLFGYFARQLRCTIDADDLAQETMIKVWKQVGKYSADKGSCASWLMRIAYRVLLDRVRKSKRIVHGGRLERISMEYVQPSETDESEIDRAEMSEAAADMISSLLTRQETLSSEAAEVLSVEMGISVEDVRDAFFATRQRMRESVRHRDRIESLRAELRTRENLEEASKLIPTVVQRTFPWDNEIRLLKKPRK